MGQSNPTGYSIDAATFKSIRESSSAWKRSGSQIVGTLSIAEILQILTHYALSIGYGPGAVNQGAAGSATGNKLSTNENQIKHMFRNSEGHFLHNTIENRAIIEKAAGNTNNFLGVDKFGNSWYAEILSNGAQAWAEVRGGIITEGGLNQIPKVFDPMTGLKSNVLLP